jgi:hypothetical protein
MRVELTDWNMQQYSITSRNARTIGDWFAEHANNLMTGDNRLSIRIAIWPQSHEEMELIGGNRQEIQFTQDGLLHLAEIILGASKKLGDLEEASPS